MLQITMGTESAFSFRLDKSNFEGVEFRVMKPSVKVISRFRSALASALMLWCAGAGCMMVSYAHGAAMTGAAGHDIHSRGANWSVVSASVGTHDCCKARHKSERRADSSAPDHALLPASATEETELAEVPNQSDAMSCCPLTSGTFVVSSRRSAGSEKASVGKNIDAVSIVTNGSTNAARSRVLHLPYQSQTHLRLCVFLI